MGFSIGEVSQAVGLAPQTLRLWERERLIRPRRTDRGYRVYTEPDVQRLREIKQLRKVEGLNFAAIRKQLGTAPDDQSLWSRRPAGRPKRRGSGCGGCRIRAHKTLKEVSEATGLSISFISALERGGFGSFGRLAAAAGGGLRGEHARGFRRRPGAELPAGAEPEMPVMQWDNGVRFEEMASGEKVMDPSYIRVPAGAGSEGFYSHNGEEFIYVISGRLFVELKDHGTFR